MTDKLEVGQLRIWKDWAHMDSVFTIVKMLGSNAFYKYMDENGTHSEWVGGVDNLLRNTTPYTKLHKLLLGMTDNE